MMDDPKWYCGKCYMVSGTRWWWVWMLKCTRLTKGLSVEYVMQVIIENK